MTGGIPVTRPPGSTELGLYSVIHSGFDGLEIAFQGCIPDALADRLDKAKAEAQRARKEHFIEVNGMTFGVAETGLRGGYQYRVNSGPNGGVWGLRRSGSVDMWNLRVSSHSLCCALNGFEGTIAHHTQFLETIGAIPYQSSWQSVARVSRIDYAVDIVTDGFRPVVSTLSATAG